MASEFKSIIEDYAASRGFVVSKVLGTHHWNVLRLYDPINDKYYIAKGILHIEGDEELGSAHMNEAFKTETKILLELPDWWGLSLIDSFTSGSFRIVITPEIINCKWSLYDGHSDKQIAAQLYKQITWLHKHNIIHNDLELKNVLLSCDNKHVTIIDFEKASHSSSATKKAADYNKLIVNLRESEHTAGIASKLASLFTSGQRRHSVGGGRRKRNRYTIRKRK